MDLFDSPYTNKQGRIEYDQMAPLAVRMRPQNLKEIVGQKHILGPSSILRNLIEGTTNQVSSVILWGPAGCGKTTLAYLVANNQTREFVELSAVTSGVKEVREIIDNAKRKLITNKIQTVLFIDEIHRFSKSQQDALLPAVENHWVILIAATTENPYFSINSPLLSRSILLTLKSHNDQDITELLKRAIKDPRGYNNQLEYEQEALEIITTLSAGDCRKALTILEACATKTLNEHDTPYTQTTGQNQNDNNNENETKPKITKQTVLTVCDSADIKYDKDDHYDVVSAFIKSIRGSHVDAALHYLARMIEGGEDLRFITRRIMISAAEDIGMADPNALNIAVSAATACEKIGLPESRIILSEAVTYLALAPKSNSVYKAIDMAIADVKSGKGKTIPMHLRDAHYKGAKGLGHGLDYKYPHAYPNSIVPQQYMPNDLQDKTYYEPTENGHEKNFKNIVLKLRKILKNKL